MYENLVCVSKERDLKRQIMKETHCSAYVMHPESTKIHRTIKQSYSQNSMKREIVEYVSRCLMCQQIKVEHQGPTEKLQSLPISEWKWDYITIDFISDLPKIRKDNDAIWMIIDRLTKLVHFLSIKMTFTLDRLLKIYV